MVSVFKNLFRRPAVAAAPEERADDKNSRWLFSVLADFMKSDSGEVVTANNAMAVAAVHAAVRCLAETVATLPCHAYRLNPDGTRQRILSPALRPVTSGMINNGDSWHDFVETAMVHLLLRGNAYAFVIRDDDGNAYGLVPLPADRVTVRVTDSGNLVYLFRDRNQRERQFAKSEILHVKNLSQDGIVGMSQIALARESLGLARAQDKYAAKLFSNSARPSGILTTDAPLKEDAAKQNRDMWNAIHGGSDNAHRVAVLTNGLKWQPVAMSNEDSQFLESRRFSVEEVARIFRLPPHMIADLSHATFSNIEHQSISFLQHTIMPWLSRWESAIQRDLIADENVFCEFRTEELLRGDITSRYQAYAVGRQWGWLSPNDVRRMENLNPIPGGDTFLIPLNMEATDKPAEKKSEDRSLSNGHSQRANGHTSEVLNWRS